MLAEFGEQRVADLLVGGRHLRPRAQRLAHHADQVGAAHDADQHLAAQHRHAADVAAFHDLRHLLDRRVLAHRHHVAGHHVLDLEAVGLDVFFRLLGRAEQELLPARAGLVGLELDPAQEVALGQDANQFPFGIDHGKPAHPRLDHFLDRLAERRAGGDGDHVAGHDVSGLHGSSPRFGCLLRLAHSSPFCPRRGPFCPRRVSIHPFLKRESAAFPPLLP